MKAAVLTDPALGSFYRDVDDVLALIMLASHARMIATTEGNADAVQAYVVANMIRDFMGMSATVHPSPKIKERYNVEDSVEALKKALDRNYDIISIAPNTYLARALMETSPKGQLLVVMGGTKRYRYFNLFPEFNFWKDPEAARIVLEAEGWESIYIVPLDATVSAKISCKRIFKVIQSSRIEWKHVLLKGIKPWCITSKLLFRGFIPHDLVAALLYKCLTYYKKCGSIGLEEAKIKVVKDFLKYSPNGVTVNILKPNPRLADDVIKDFSESIEQAQAALHGK